MPGPVSKTQPPSFIKVSGPHRCKSQTQNSNSGPERAPACCEVEGKKCALRVGLEKQARKFIPNVR